MRGGRRKGGGAVESGNIADEFISIIVLNEINWSSTELSVAKLALHWTMQDCGEGQLDFSLSQQFFFCGQSILAMAVIFDIAILVIAASALADVAACTGASTNAKAIIPNRMRFKVAVMRCSNIS